MPKWRSRDHDLLGAVIPRLGGGAEHPLNPTGSAGSGLPTRDDRPGLTSRGTLPFHVKSPGAPRTSASRVTLRPGVGRDA